MSLASQTIPWFHDNPMWSILESDLDRGKKIKQKKEEVSGNLLQKGAVRDRLVLWAPLGACEREKGRFSTGEAKRKGERREGKEEEGKRQQMTLHLAQRNQDVKNNINQATEGRDKIQ